MRRLLRLQLRQQGRRLRPQPLPRRLHLSPRRRLRPQPLPLLRRQLLRLRRRPPRRRRPLQRLRRRAAVRARCGSIHRATSITAMGRRITVKPKKARICLRPMRRPKGLIRITGSPALSDNVGIGTKTAPLMPGYRLQGRWLIKRIISRKRSPEIWRDLALILSSVSSAV